MAVIFHGSRLDRREDGPLLQLVRLALIVAAPSRCGGPRGRIPRRRRRGPEGLRAVGGAQARNGLPKGPPGDAEAVPRSGQRVLRAALAKIGGQPGPRRAARALDHRE